MKIRINRQAGLSLLLGLFIAGGILLLGIGAAVVLSNTIDKVLPKGPPIYLTNTFGQVTMAQPVEVHYTEPPLVFPYVGAVIGGNESTHQPMATLEIERSTNLVHWETIAVLGPTDAWSMRDDTNPPPHQAFYRGKWVLP